MKSKNISFLLIMFLIITGFAYSGEVPRPKLVVGIVIDQMRYDYLYKFYPYYDNGGFKRLMNDGSNFTFAHFNYVPTYTGPGHTSVYTGSTPFYHGIIANNWYDKETGKSVYCAYDPTVKTVGSDDNEGKMSPHRLLATTITDQLRLSNNFLSRVVSISLKDRAAILPGGRSANAAYWYDTNNGKFITSSYYMDKLPDWVNSFNREKLADKYMSGSWQLARPLKDYEVSMPDASASEKDVFKEGNTTFPHLFDSVQGNKKYAALESTPYGNKIVLDFAEAALKGEKLGEGKYTDFLAISFSSTDFVGHAYGPNSFEIEDTYIRLDAQIAQLLSALDKQVGKGNYVVFLTADHAVVENNGFRQEHKLNAGGLGTKAFEDSLNAFAGKKFGDKNLVADFSNNQIFFDYKELAQKNLDIHLVEQSFADYIRQNFPAVTEIFTRDDLEGHTPSRATTNLVLNGFNMVRSGDIAFGLQPGYLPNFLKQGTSHGTYYAYDTHVPMLFYGWHVPKQTVNRPVYIVDVAATIADLLKITEPDCCIGVPLIK